MDCVALLESILLDKQKVAERGEAHVGDDDLLLLVSLLKEDVLCIETFVYNTTRM